MPPIPLAIKKRIKENTENFAIKREELERLQKQHVFVSVLDEFDALPHQQLFLEDYESRNICLCGGFGCFGSETIIGGRSVLELMNAPFHVKTLFGVAEASPVYCKGKADLYQVETAGGRSITVTMNHRFLSQFGWAQLKHLQIGSLIAVDDSQNAEKSLGKAKDLRVFDRSGFHSCDELPSPQSVFLQEAFQQSSLPNTSHCRGLCHPSPLSTEGSCRLDNESFEFLSQYRSSLKSFQLCHRELQTSEIICECCHHEIDILQGYCPCRAKGAQCQFSYSEALPPWKSTFESAFECKSLFAQKCRSQNIQSYTLTGQHRTDQVFPLSLSKQTKYARHLTLCKCHKPLTLHKDFRFLLLSPWLSVQHSDNLRNSQPEQYYLQENPFGIRPVSASYLPNKKHDNSITSNGWDSITKIEFVRNDFFYDFHVPVWNHYEAHGIYHHNSGKTKSLLYKLIDLAHRNAGYSGGLYAPTAELARDVLIPELDEILELAGIKYEYWSAPNPRYKLHFKEGTTTVLVRSMENWKRIVGNNFAFACIDEIDTIKPDVAEIAWKKIMGRLRAGNVFQIATTSTPEGFKFLYKWFVKEAKEGRRLIKAKTTDNPYLKKDFIEDLFNNYGPQLVEAYVNGEFVNLTSGTVYSNFDRRLNACSDTIKEGEPLHIGMDFNVNHMAAILIVLRDGFPRVVDEIVEREDTPAMIKEIKGRYEGHSIIIYPDASGGNTSSKGASVSDLALLRQAGLKVKVNGTNPAVKDRVSSVQAGFLNATNQRRLLVNVDKCPTLTESLEQQVWTDKGDPDKTQGLDHVLDALGYAIMYLLPIKKPVTAAVQIQATW